MVIAFTNPKIPVFANKGFFSVYKGSLPNISVIALKGNATIANIAIAAIISGKLAIAIIAAGAATAVAANGRAIRVIFLADNLIWSASILLKALTATLDPIAKAAIISAAGIEAAIATKATGPTKANGIVATNKLIRPGPSSPPAITVTACWISVGFIIAKVFKARNAVNANVVVRIAAATPKANGAITTDAAIPNKAATAITPTNPKIATIATPTILGVIVLKAFNATKAKLAKAVVRVAANKP